MPGKVYSQLAELANERHGFVTPADARELGIDPMNLVRMAERGQLERRGNGIYRFPLSPPNSLDAFMEASLWPRGTRGVLSHETALALYELSDVHPSKIHLTVARLHRIRRTIPPQYRIHHEDLKANQTAAYEGIPIVTPVHAIRQAHRSHLGPAILAQAIDHGQRNGRLTTGQAKELRREVGVPAGDGSRR